MTGKIKTIGLALVAVFAMSAVVASAASATSGTLTTFPTAKTVVVTGEQVGEHVLTLTDHLIGGVGAKAKCKKGLFDGVGTSREGDTTVTVTPTYSECTAFGLNATIDHNECTFVLHTGTTTGLGGWSAKATLVCPDGKAIEITTATCEVAIGPQELGNTVEMTNAGAASPESAMDLQLDINITGIKYNVVKDGIGCPLTGLGEKFKGDYDGTATVKAHDSTTKAAVGITLHG